jgi:site-specific recombinase XerD
MLESIYRSQTLINEIDRSPYGSFIRHLAADYLRDGYKPENISHAFTQVLRFVRWAAHGGHLPRRLRAKHFCAFLTSLEQPGKTGPGTRPRRCIDRLMGLIEAKHGHRLVEKPIPPHARNPAVVRATQEFETYMRDVRGLLPTSIVRFKTTAGQFLAFRFPTGEVRTKSIQARDILDFLQVRGAQFQDRTLQTDGNALKCYLRYLYGKRLNSTDLSYAVPTIACWRNQNVVHTVTEEEMAKMLQTCDLDHPSGVRDYAVLLLLMRYGLRPIEVSRLELDDIRWSEKKIVIRGKGRKDATFPLETEVRAALNRYVNAARPRSNEKVVFLRAKAPFVPPRPSASISAIVHRIILRAGLKPKIFGARLIRYSVASRILNSGGNLMEVAELLRHSSIDTSARYMRLGTTVNWLKTVQFGSATHA